MINLAINSKTKGKVGELEFCKVCKSEGYDVRRSAQFCGNTGDAADVIGLDGIHVEVKRVEKLNIQDAMSQAIRDSEAENKGNLPIVAHRKNNCDWLITMRSEDWFKMYREYKPD